MDFSAMKPGDVFRLSDVQPGDWVLYIACPHCKEETPALAWLSTPRMHGCSTTRPAGAASRSPAKE